MREPYGILASIYMKIFISCCIFFVPCCFHYLTVMHVRRGLPPKKDPHWMGEVKNRDIIEPHKNSIRASIIANGIANSQVVYAVAWNVKTRQEAYHLAVAAEKGETTSLGKPIVFTLLGGNHQWTATTEAVPILEKTNPTLAKEVRILKANIICFPNYSDKTEAGRASIIRELRNVSALFPATIRLLLPNVL